MIIPKKQKFVKKYITVRNELMFGKYKLLILYLSVSLTIFTYRYFMMWRIPINKFYADEKDWLIAASNKNFFQYIVMPDAGYPVPLTRAFFWITTSVSSDSALILHLFSCLVSGLCASSLILFGNLPITVFKKIVVAFSLGFYQAFDLLLWHQVNYYLFIPVSIFMISKISREENLTTSKFLSFFLVLLIGIGKPQLVLSCMFILVLSAARQIVNTRKIRVKKIEYILILFLFASLILGRLSTEALELTIKPKNLIYALVGLLKVPAIVIFPFYTVTSLGFAKIVDSKSINILTNLVIIIISLCIYLQFGKSKYNKLSYKSQQVIWSCISGVIPIYLSIFFFINSGWSQNLFWYNECNSCMIGRHFFGIYFLLLLIFQFFFKSKILILIPIQFVILNIFSWEYLNKLF